MQATGNTMLSMTTQLTGAVINIILDPIMIFGLLGTPQMGVAGAAAATVIGQIGGMLLGFVLNQLKNHELKVVWRGFHPEASVFKSILAVGFPSIIMQSISSFMNVLMNLILIGFGNTAVSVLGVYFKLQSFVFMPVFGLSNGLVAIVGYNYGARLRQRVYDAIRVAVKLAVAIMAVGTLAFLLIPETLLSLFEAEGASDLTAIGVVALRTISSHFILAAIGYHAEHGIQAIGKGFFSLLMSMCRQLIVLLPAAWILSQIGGLNAVWWCFPRGGGGIPGRVPGAVQAGGCADAQASEPGGVIVLRKAGCSVACGAARFGLTRPAAIGYNRHSNTEGRRAGWSPW